MEKYGSAYKFVLIAFLAIFISHMGLVQGGVYEECVKLWDKPCRAANFPHGCVKNCMAQCLGHPPPRTTSPHFRKNLNGFKELHKSIFNVEVNKFDESS